MNIRHLVCISLAAGAIAVTGCGGGSSHSTAMTNPPPVTTAPPTTPDNSTFVEIQAIASGQSETSDPLPVDGGAFTAPANDETSDPQTVTQ